jgi:diaminohydroxyphosphoribosylaminopyrimidine deaminase / 5-amino-6-(5-phosphoribosylamino)uracil reductase
LLPLDELDSMYLERALELAESGRGLTSPNPLVGSVIVSTGGVVGEGHHTAAGRDHAEIAALKDAAARVGGSSPPLTGATIYVTLEPCCCWGRTPPCVPALVSAGFSRVVVGAVDPSPKVNGQGIKQLRAAGIKVDVAEGDLSTRCKRQNDGFRKSVATGLPFVVYKYAMTLDGRVASDTGDSKWISGVESRLSVHQMRSWMDAVMVGAGTMQMDDPMLTARDVDCSRQPLRVLVDSNLSVERGSSLVRTVDQGPVLVVCSETVPEARRAEVESWGLEVTAVPEIGEPASPATAKDGAARPDPVCVARLLAARGVQNVLLEGGATLAGSWWTAGLIDKVVAFVSPRLLSGRIPRSALQGPGGATIADGTTLREVDVRQVGADVCISGYLSEAY